MSKQHAPASDGLVVEMLPGQNPAASISEEGREFMRRRRESPPFAADGFNLAALCQCMGGRREPVNLPVRITRTESDGIPGEWVVAEGADPDLRLLYLHGGGYISGSSGFYLTLAARLSIAARCAVLLPNYRLAPAYRFPAAFEDALRAYEWLSKSGPDKPSPAQALFIAGDEVGAGLALAILQTLRDRRCPLPRGAITLSALTDLTLSGKSIQSEVALDPIMHPNLLPPIPELYLGDADARNPLASPVFGDCTGLPPLLIQAAEHELIRDDSIQLAARAKAAGVKVTLQIWPGMFHEFQVHEPLLPEGRAAIEHIATFMRSCWKG